jgi:protein SCO1/2
MPRYIAILLAAALGAVACGSSSQRTYTLQGQVLSVTPDHQQATIRHEEIKGLMPAMTMPYKVKDPQLLRQITPGDLINATLVVTTHDAYLSAVRKVGEAPLAAAPGDPLAAKSRYDLLQPGDPVPDVQLVDQDGHQKKFSAFEGSPVVVTFMYTRCPLPTFCPLMDRHFATIQQTLETDPTLKKVHLVSVSFDPATDTPPVLKKHARELKADPARWTFFTGKEDDIDRFAAHFGVVVTRDPTDPTNITHTLCTAIIGADGRLVKSYPGNEWTPAQVLADLKPVVHAG